MSHSANAQFYPLERDRFSKCTEDPVTGKVHDTRYKSLNLTISEYDIQYTSGVDTKIHSKPLFQKYFTPNVE
jgi:hypothetical protein